MLAGWVASGHIAWFIIALTGFEAAFLILYRRITGDGLTLGAFLPSLLAGDFLLLAWATNAIRLPWTYTALALLASLVAHLVQVRQGWERKQR